MNLPKAFEDILAPVLGNEYEDFLASCAQVPPVSVRLNDKHPLECENIGRVEHCSSAYYLPERPVFALDPLWHCGAYYVQEASSMYLEQVIGEYVKSPVRLLDLCAAPGGKTTHASNLLKDSLIVANEIVPSRAVVLRENVQKWGNPNTMVCNNAPADFSFLEDFFDVLLCDMPCSGEGMFRKEPEALAQWSSKLVADCAARQRSILKDVWNTLKTGGLLIYSTCTFNPFENEENIEWAAKTLGAEILHAKHFYFHKFKGEGLFMAVLRKTSDNDNSFVAKPQKSKKLDYNPYFGLLKDADHYKLENINGFDCALPAEYAADIVAIAKRLNVLSAGITLGETGQKKPQASAALAWSKQLDAAKVPVFEADKNSALSYLKGESFYAGNLPKQELLVKFGSFPLGWANNIGTRANNLYPKSLRIKISLQQCKSYFWEPGHRQESPI